MKVQKKKKIHLGYGVKTLLLLPAFGVALTGTGNDADYAYSDEDRTLSVTVGTDSEQQFDFDGYGRYLTENLATNFVKLGEGTLVGTSDISAYLGDITIEAGTYAFTTNCALGKLAAENVCGSVYVKDGATLEARPLRSVMGSSGQPWGWWNKRICFEGEGVGGMGALRHTGDREIGRMVFSSNLVMTADATMGNSSSYTLYMSGGSNPMWLDMNGHTLTFVGPVQIAWGCWNIKNPGNIVSYANLTIQNGNTRMGGDASNVLTCRNRRALSFSKTSGMPIDWTLDARELGRIHVADGGDAYNRTNCSYWAGPVLLGENRLTVSFPKSLWMSLCGPISGTGGLYVHSSMQDAPGQLNLIGTGNTFTGGIGMNQSTLALWDDGALPPDGSALSMTNSTVLLNGDDEAYSLPDLNSHGAGSVKYGYGTWKSATKTGSGNLVWDSCSGAKSLDVKEGMVELRSVRRSIAGLIESERKEFATYDETMAAWDTVFTNIVTLGADAYYNSAHHLWNDPIQNPASNRFMIAYTGYIWNDTKENARWSFAGLANTHLNVRLDGEQVFYYKGLSEKNSSMHGTVEVAPGPHKIDVRGYSTRLGNNNLTSGGSMVNGQTGEMLYWPKANFAVGFDPTGQDSTNQQDYVKLVDPGDGSLLTWALPEDVEQGVTTVPGTGRKVYVKPSFENMAFAAGTGIVSGHESFSVENLEGLPVITGMTGSFTIGSSWTIDAVDIVGGAKLSTEGSLTFASGSAITVLDETRIGRRKGDVSFVVAEAAGGIVWPEDVKVYGATLEWHLSLSADGKQIIGRHVPVGTKVILR